MPNNNLIRVKLTRTVSHGGFGALAAPISESSVVELPDDNIPENAVRVDADTPLHDWQEDA